MPLPFILGGIAAVATGYGAKKGYEGYQNKDEAERIAEKAQSKYSSAKFAFDKANSRTENALEELGELQLKIGETLGEYDRLVNKLIEKLDESNHNSALKLSILEYRLDKIRSLTMSTTAYLGQLAGAAGAGGVAAFAVYGGVMALAAASTGTPIAALSGAAAYNATMAAIGGGSLAAGGFGMAGGAMVLGGVVAAPIIAIAGWAYANHAVKALDDAKAYHRKVEDAVEKMDLGRVQLGRTSIYVEKIYDNLSRYFNTIFMEYLDFVQYACEQLEKGLPLTDEPEEIKRKIANGYAVAAILVDIIVTPLFKPKLDAKGKAVVKDNIPEFDLDKHGMKVINKEQIDDVLTSSESGLGSITF